MCDIDAIYVRRVVQECNSSRRVGFLRTLSVHCAARTKVARMVYQRLCSILEQIQTILSVEVSDHVGGDERRVLAFSYSKEISRRSSLGFRGSLTPLQVRPCVYLEVGGLEELGERGELPVA